MLFSHKWHNALYLSLLVIIIMGIIPQQSVAGSNGKEDWKTHVEPSIQKMERFYSEVCASSITKTTGTLKLKGSKEKVTKKVELFENLQRSGGALKHLTRIIEPNGKIAESVYCRNPGKYVFELARA